MEALRVNFRKKRCKSDIVKSSPPERSSWPITTIDSKNKTAKQSDTGLSCHEEGGAPRSDDRRRKGFRCGVLVQAHYVGDHDCASIRIVCRSLVQYHVTLSCIVVRTVRRILDFNLQLNFQQPFSRNGSGVDWLTAATISQGNFAQKCSVLHFMILMLHTISHR